MNMNTNTTARQVNHLIRKTNTTHAAADLPRFGAHVTACNGRAMRDVAAWNGHRDEITCKGCLSALANGKAEWIVTTTAAA